MSLQAGVFVGLLGGCALRLTDPQAPSQPSAAAPGLMDVLDGAGERALFDALRAYEDGQYETTERALHQALGSGMRSSRDRATAMKLIAFIACTSNRLQQCETAFRAAKDTDPRFRLSTSEEGHPVWGPIYRRVMATP